MFGRIALVCLFGLAWNPLASAQKQRKAKPAPAPAINENLRLAADHIAFLVQSTAAFEAPSADQKTKVMTSLQALESLSHAAKTSSAVKSAVDPIMRYVSLDMPQKFQQIQSVYRRGNYPHARYILKQTVHYCVSCHAVNSPKNPGLFPFPAPAPGSSELARAEYFGGVRKFKEAMLAYEHALIDRNFRTGRPEQWYNALENLLAITIRMRNDAHVTLEMTSRLLEDGGLSVPQRDLLVTWRNSAKNWTREKLRHHYAGGAAISKAQLLIEQGNALSAKGRSYGYVEYLRAMNMFNDLAISGETEMLKSAGFRLAGEVSEKLQYVTAWMYPEAYYEACIRALPHSTESQRCWDNFQTYRSHGFYTLWDQGTFDALREEAR